MTEELKKIADLIIHLIDEIIANDCKTNKRLQLIQNELKGMIEDTRA